MQKYISFTELFNAYIGREVDVTEKQHDYKFGNKMMHGTTCALAHKKDPLIEDMRETALSRGYTDMAVYLPGDLRIGKYPRFKDQTKNAVAVDIKKDKADGKYKIAGYTIL